MGAYWDCQFGHVNAFPLYATPYLCEWPGCEGTYDGESGYSAPDDPWPGDPNACDENIASCLPPEGGRKPVKECPGPHEFDLLDLTLVSGAADIAAGPGCPPGTRIAAAVRRSASGSDVVLQAVLSEDMSYHKHECEVIEWVGGEPVDEDPLLRRVPCGEWGKHTVTCKHGDQRFSMVVYVLGASLEGFQGVGGSPYTESTPHHDFVGSFPVDPASGEVRDHCMMRFKVQPPELIADGNASVFDKAQLHWDVSRDKRARYWDAKRKKIEGIFSDEIVVMWRLEDDRPDWHSDDASDTDDEDNDPYDNGYLYSGDSPHSTPIDGTTVREVKKLRMREYVRIRLAGGPYELCSDYMYWHCFRSITRPSHTKPWVETGVWGGNTIAAGDPGWGHSPMSPGCKHRIAEGEDECDECGKPVTWSL